MYNIKVNFKNNKYILLLEIIQKAFLLNNFDEIKTLPALLYLLHRLSIRLNNTKINMNIIEISLYIFSGMKYDFLLYQTPLNLLMLDSNFLYYDIKNNCIINSKKDIIEELNKYRKLNKKEYAKIVRKINAENR